MAHGDSARDWLDTTSTVAPATKYQAPASAIERGRKRSATRKADAEQHLPKARHHPCDVRREAQQHRADDGPGDADGEEMLDRIEQHRVRESVMAARARHHLDADEPGREDRDGAP